MSHSDGVHVKQTRYNRTECENDQLNQFIRWCYSDDKIDPIQDLPYSSRKRLMFNQYKDYEVQSATPNRRLTGADDNMTVDDALSPGPADDSNPVEDDALSPGPADDSNAAMDDALSSAADDSNPVGDDALSPGPGDDSNAVLDDALMSGPRMDDNSDTPTPSLSPAPTSTPLYREFAAPRNNDTTAVVDDSLGFWIPELLTPQEVVNIVNHIQESHYIDQGTKLVSVDMLVVNNEYGIIALLTCYLNFQRGGLTIPSFDILSVVADPYGTRQNRDKLLAYGALFCATAFLPIFSRFLESRRSRREGSSWFTVLADGWIAIDILQLVFLGLVIQEWVHLTNELNDGLDKIQTLARQAVDDEVDVYPPDYEAPFEDMRYILGKSGPARVLRVYSFFCSFISMIFCLKCFREHPELSLLTRTIMKTCSEGVHFLVILVLVLSSYLFSVLIIFGHQLPGFL